MNAYAAIARTLGPRSPIIVGGSLLALLFIIVATREFNGQSVGGIQLAFGGAALILGIFGLGLGTRVRALHAWPPAILVPGMLTRQARFYAATLLLAWGAWVWASGLTRSPDAVIPLVGAALGLWAGATSHRASSVLIAVLICAIMLFSADQFSHGAFALSAVAIIAMAWARLSYMIRHTPPPTANTHGPSLGRLPGQWTFTQWCADRAFHRLRSGSMPQSARLELALGVAAYSDWLGASLLSLVAPVAMTFVYAVDPSNPERLVGVATTVDAFVIVVLAESTLRLYERHFDRLWVSTSLSRRELARQFAMNCIGQSVRLTACCIVAVTAFACALDVEPMYDWIFFLLFAPASGALLLAASSWLRGSAGRNRAFLTISSVFGLLLLQYQLAGFVSHVPPSAAFALALCASGFLIPIGVHLCATADPGASH